MNEQQTLDKAGTPRRLNNMNNETGSIYGLLVNSEEKGRGRLEAAVFATCILSVVAAIMQFVGQPTPDPFAGFESPAQTAPIISHHTVEASLDTKS
jgi:hypothetical protein